jgi:hypothetical protein
MRLRRVRQRPHRTAIDFRNALENEFRGAFSDVVFAITDWSPDCKLLAPFRDKAALKGKKKPKKRCSIKVAQS